MNETYYKRLLHKLRKAYMKRKTVDMRLTKHEVEDLFHLWNDEAVKKWGLNGKHLEEKK